MQVCKCFPYAAILFFKKVKNNPGLDSPMNNDIITSLYQLTCPAGHVYKSQGSPSPSTI